MSTAAEMRPDMNGSSVVNGHASVNGAQANDRLIGCANGHANGDAMDRNRCSVTDVADPTFSTTFDRETSNIPTSDDHVHTQNAELVYHGLQLAAFTIMAAVFMRLKLFWTPHMSLFASLLASDKLFGWLGNAGRRQAVTMVVIAAMSFQGIANVQHQRSIRSEFSNPNLEQLIHWINASTTPEAVFAGPMPTMATIKLCTSRPIVNHPHYEDADLRRRTKLVYAMYSRKPDVDVWTNFRQLRVNYAVLEAFWCFHQPSKAGCSLPEIWDVEDAANRNRKSTCSLLHACAEPYFRRVFANAAYHVLEVKKTTDVSPKNRKVFAC